MSDSVIKNAVIIGSFTSIIVTVCNIVSQAMLARYFGLELFGVLTLILTLGSYCGMLNLGIPTASLVLANNDSKTKDKVIKNAIAFTLLLVAGFSSLLFFAYFLKINFQSFFVGNSLQVYDVNGAILFSMVAFVLRFPIQQLAIIYATEQNQVPQKISELVFGLLPLVSAVITVHYKLSIDSFFSTLLILTLLISIGSNFVLIRKCRINLFCLYKRFKFSECYELVKTGIGFFLLGLPVMIAPTLDNVLLSRYNLFSEISGYSFSSKIFIYLFGFVNLFSVSLFGLIGTKSSPDDMNWARSRINFGANYLSILNGVILIAAICFFSSIFYIWTGGLQSDITIEFILLFAMYVYLLPLINIISSSLSGLNLKRGITVLAYLEVLVHILISYMFIPYFGLVAIPIALFASSLVVPYVFLPILFKQTSLWTDGVVALNYKISFFAFLPTIVLMYFVSCSLNINLLFDQFFLFLISVTSYISLVYLCFKFRLQCIGARLI